MQVQVEDALSRARPNVVDGAVTLLDAALARELRRGQLAIANDLRLFRLRLFQSDDVLLGDDEQVRGRLRIMSSKATTLSSS
jgi:hypothetical protein